jgi:serine/threonine-protein kinase HipA
MNPVEKLLYLGERGAGALCYVPALSPGEESFPVEVSQLAPIVQEIHEKKQKFELKEAGTETKKGLAALVSMSSSAGGARAKAILAWNRDTDMFRSGQTYAGEGYSYWILKFDGASESGSIKGPPGYGKIEYAYYKMARDAGIQMSESRLYADAHFMTKRFDRSDGGEKLHMLSLGALGHYDYNRPTEHTYEQAFGILKKLGGGNDEREQLFRRMAFNIIARNQDDHVKNISFLMDKSGKWSLSPAYDMTYAWKAIGWTAKHQMSMNGKRDGFTKNDFVEFGKTVGLKQGASARLLGEVKIAVNKWEQYAEDSGVEKIVQQQIKEKHRMNL